MQGQPGKNRFFFPFVFRQVVFLFDGRDKHRLTITLQRIANDGVAHLFHMHPYLGGAAGMNMKLYQ